MMAEPSTFIVAPCKVCGTQIEDEGPVDDDWICTRCWPGVRIQRLEAQLAAEQKEVKRLQELYDVETTALNQCLRDHVERNRKLELSLKEASAIQVDGLVERAAYVVRLETALRLIITLDMSDAYYQRMKSEGMIERPPGFGTPKQIAVAALDVPKKPTLA